MQEVNVNSSRTARPKLSIAAIHAAALELIEKSSLEALSMRSLAAALGVDPMAMYHHIPNKAALISGLYNTVLADLIPDSAREESWQDGLKTLARQYRALALRYPNLFPSLIASNPTSENAYKAFERLHGLLLQTGLSAERVVQAADAYFAFVTGFALVELHDASAKPDQTDLEFLARADPSDYPHLTGLLPVLSATKLGGSFEFGLEVFISGLEQALIPARGRELSVARGHEVDE
jgi:TetR/AcrR family transcriptional regulator, tetracycline repressor protein